MIQHHGHSNLPQWKEVDRLAALQKFDILDTEPEVEFDSIVKIVRTAVQNLTTVAAG
jgi:hypothetical protein